MRMGMPNALEVYHKAFFDEYRAPEEMHIERGLSHGKGKMIEQGLLQ